MILRKDAQVNNLNSYRYKGFAKPLILSQKGSESRQIGLQKIIGKYKMVYSTYGKSWQILKLVQMANIAAYIYIYISETLCDAPAVFGKISKTN
jgi:hypothetical protein